MRKSGLLNPFMLLVCWTCLVLGGTYVLIETTVRQELALKFPTTKGRIIRSEMGEGHIVRRGVEIEYTYNVGKLRFHGHRYRYDDHNMTLEWQSTIVENPRWSSQKVYYNPENPSESLLEPGIDGGDLLLLLFALPMNVLTGILWRAMLSRLRDIYRVHPAGGVRVRRQKNLTRVPLGDMSALGASFYGMALAAFVAAFPVVIFGGFDPSMRLMKRAWAVVFLSGVAAFLWQMFRNWSGAYDLRIEQNSQSIVLPQTGGRSSHVALDRKEISGVCVQRRMSKGPSGVYFSYLPALNRKNAEANAQSMKLVTWGWSEEKARAFGQWLSAELAVDFKGVEDEITPHPAKS